MRGGPSNSKRGWKNFFKRNKFWVWSLSLIIAYGRFKILLHHFLLLRKISWKPPYEILNALKTVQMKSRSRFYNHIIIGEKSINPFDVIQNDHWYFLLLHTHIHTKK